MTARKPLFLTAKQILQRISKKATDIQATTIFSLVYIILLFPIFVSFSRLRKGVASGWQRWNRMTENLEEAKQQY